MKSFLFTLLSLFVVNSFAQSNYAPEPRGYRVLVSVFAGPTIDWVQPSTSDYSRIGVAPGFRVGIPVEINLTDRENFYFTTGVQLKFDHTVLNLPERYTILETETSSTNISTIADRHFSRLYLTIPTGVKMKTAISSRNILGFNVGLYHSLFSGVKLLTNSNLKLYLQNFRLPRIKRMTTTLPCSKNLYMPESDMSIKFNTIFAPTFM